MPREQERNSLPAQQQMGQGEPPPLHLPLQGPAAICVLRGPEHLFEFANSLSCQLVGNRALIGKPVREVLPELEGQGFFELLDQVYTTGEPFIGTEMRVMIDRHLSGVLEEGFFNIVYQPCCNATGVRERILVTAVEVTEQVQARQPIEEPALQLNHERARLGLAQQVARIGTFEWLILQNRFLWTPELQAVYGLTPATDDMESTLEEWLERLHPDDRARTRQDISTALNSGADFQIEFRILWPDKSIHYLTARVRVFKDEGGQPQRLLGINIDTTECKQGKILITGQKQALELLVEDAPLSHALHTLVLMFEELGVLTSILLLDKEGLRLRYAAAHSLPEGFQRAMDGFPIGPHAGTCGAAIYRREAVYASDIASDPLCADYKDLALSYGLRACWSIPILSSNGKALGTFAVYYREPRLPSEHEKRLIDLVTHTAAIAIERKQTEEQLKESEERFRSLSESSPVGIFLVDTQGQTIYTNLRCQEISGLAFEETLGLGWMRTVHPDDLEATTSMREKGLHEGCAYALERRYVHPDGSIRWTKVRSSPMFSDQGEYLGRTGTVEDITELKVAEERKDEFIRMASHELKTPVTSLKGFTQLLQRRFKQHGDAESLRFLNIMNEQLNKLTELISDMLDLSQIQAGKLIYREEYFDLDVLVQEVLEHFQATTSSHQLLLKESAHAPVFGDKNRMRQVLINLLTNAAKYSPQANQVVVRLSTEQDSARVDVQDFGLGISEADQKKIFEQFYQVADPEMKTFPGLGIGLYISQEIIKRHHGQLWVKSTKGHGATFSFRVPLAESNATG